MLRFLIFAWSFGFGSKRRGHRGSYDSEHTLSENTAYERARRRRVRSWWPRPRIARS